MPQKYIALLLIALGIAALVHAVRMDPKASFEGGSFINEIGLVLIGGTALAVGVGWVLVLLFMGL